MNRDTMNAAQRDVWSDLLQAYQDDPSIPLDMPAWARFLEDVTRLLDGGLRCVWRGQSVHIDDVVPYLLEPHPNFPIVEEGRTATFHQAWRLERRPPPEHLVERYNTPELDERQLDIEDAAPAMGD